MEDEDRNFYRCAAQHIPKLGWLLSPQVCAGQRSEEDKGTGAILKCLVANVDTVSSSCARETARAARNALQFYQPKAPVTDVCDSDIASLCLGSQGLNSFGVGQVSTTIRCVCKLRFPWSGAVRGALAA